MFWPLKYLPVQGTWTGTQGPALDAPQPILGCKKMKLPKILWTICKLLSAVKYTTGRDQAREEVNKHCVTKATSMFFFSVRHVSIELL